MKGLPASAGLAKSCAREINWKSPSFQRRLPSVFLILAPISPLAHALPPEVNKIGVLSLSVVAAILLPTMLTSCGEKTHGGKEKTAQKSEDDFLDKDAKPDEPKNLNPTNPDIGATAHPH